MYQPRDSIYTPPPRERYIKHPLDYLVNQAAWYNVLPSYGAHATGRRVLPPTTSFEIPGEITYE